MILDPDYNDIIKAFSTLVANDPQGTLERVESLLSREEVCKDMDVYALLKSRQALCYKALYETKEERLFLDNAITSFSEALDATADGLLKADIGYELGLTIALKAHDADSLDLLMDAISALERASSYFEAPGHEDDLGSINWNIGVLYHDVAEMSPSETYYLKSIAHYTKALDVYSGESDTLRFAQMKESMGLAYSDLAVLTSELGDYLPLAFNAFREASEAYAKEGERTRSGMSAVNAGLTSLDMYMDSKDMTHIDQAHELFTVACENLQGVDEQQYEKALYNLAKVQQTLAIHNSSLEHALESVYSFTSLLGLMGHDSDVHMYAASTYELARSQHTAFSLSSDVRHLEKAIGMYQESIGVSRDVACPEELGASYLYLGDAMAELGIVNGESGHISEAFDQYDQAIRYFGDEAPVAKGTSTLHKAMALQSYYGLTGERLYLKYALSAYEGARTLLCTMETPDACAEANEMAGDAYLMAYELDGDKEKMEKARGAYSSSIRYFEKTDEPRCAAIIKKLESL